MTGITVQFGTKSDGTPIIGPCDPGTNNLSLGGAFDLVYVTLSANYVQQNPQGVDGGFPSRPPAGTVWSPLTIDSGDRRQYYRCEADAIVNAGIGVLS